MKAKRIAISGIFGVIAFLITFVEFPIFPVLPFLKFDASDSIIIFTNMVYGFIPSLFTLIVKSFLFLFKSGDGGPIGIFMNFISGFVFIGVFQLIKNKINVFISYFIASTSVGLAMYLANYYMAIPIYTNTKTPEFINSLGLTITQFFILIILFNIIKFMIDSVIAYFFDKKLEKHLNP
jgi:riboflavin transporter FmnP